MPESFATYLFQKRHKLTLLGRKKLTQEEMAQHLSRELTNRLGRTVEIRRRAYSQNESGKTVSKYEKEIREILGK